MSLAIVPPHGFGWGEYGAAGTEGEDLEVLEQRVVAVEAVEVADHLERGRVDAADHVLAERAGGGC